MFVTIRRYSPKNGAINKASLELLRRQIQDDFIPTLQGIAGFRGYYVASIDDRELLTVTLCESSEASEASTRCAADYTLRNPLLYELGRPEVTNGHVLASAERSSVSAEGGDAAAMALALWYQESRGMLLSASER